MISPSSLFINIMLFFVCISAYILNYGLKPSKTRRKQIAESGLRHYSSLYAINSIYNDRILFASKHGIVFFFPNKSVPESVLKHNMKALERKELKTEAYICITNINMLQIKNMRLRYDGVIFYKGDFIILPENNIEIVVLNET